MMCVSSVAPDVRFNFESLLVRELSQAHEAWILDAAVYGCLAMADRVDFLAAYGLADTGPNQALLTLAIDAALRTGA